MGKTNGILDEGPEAPLLPARGLPPRHLGPTQCSLNGDELLEGGRHDEEQSVATRAADRRERLAATHVPPYRRCPESVWHTYLIIEHTVISSVAFLVSAGFASMALRHKSDGLSAEDVGFLCSAFFSNIFITISSELESRDKIIDFFSTLFLSVFGTGEPASREEKLSALSVLLALPFVYYSCFSAYGVAETMLENTNFAMMKSRIGSFLMISSMVGYQAATRLSGSQAVIYSLLLSCSGQATWSSVGIRNLSELASQFLQPPQRSLKQLQSLHKKLMTWGGLGDGSEKKFSAFELLDKGCTAAELKALYNAVSKDDDVDLLRAAGFDVCSQDDFITRLRRHKCVGVPIGEVSFYIVQLTGSFLTLQTLPFWLAITQGHGLSTAGKVLGACASVFFYMRAGWRIAPMVSAFLSAKSSREIGLLILPMLFILASGESMYDTSDEVICPNPVHNGTQTEGGCSYLRGDSVAKEYAGSGFFDWPFGFNDPSSSGLPFAAYLIFYVAGGANLMGAIYLLGNWPGLVGAFKSRWNCSQSDVSALGRVEDLICRSPGGFRRRNSHDTSGSSFNFRDVVGARGTRSEPSSPTASAAGGNAQDGALAYGV